MRLVIIGIYLAVGAVHLIAGTAGHASLMEFSKGMLMPLLILFILYEREFKLQPFDYWLVGGLVCSWLGDITLLFQDIASIYFILGLICFLLAQGAYIVCFKSARWPPPNKISLDTPFKKNKWQLLAVALALIMLSIIFPYLDSFALPVIFYVVIITAMVIQAAERFMRTIPLSYRQVLTGGFLFIISNALLAIDKFVADIPLSIIWIMSTYIAAQLFISLGIIHHSPVKNS